MGNRRRHLETNLYHGVKLTSLPSVGGVVAHVVHHVRIGHVTAAGDVGAGHDSRSRYRDARVGGTQSEGDRLPNRREQYGGGLNRDALVYADQDEGEGDWLE